MISAMLPALKGIPIFKSMVLILLQRFYKPTFFFSVHEEPIYSFYLVKIGGKLTSICNAF